MATTSTPSTTTTSLPLPCLVVDYGGDRCATVFGASDGAHRAFDAEALRGKRAWPTSHGWVLVCDPATAATSLWNPARDISVSLPPLPQPPPPVESTCVLSGKPTGASGGCTVVLVEPSPRTVLWYCHAGGAAGDLAAWSRHEYDLGGTSIPVSPGGHCWCKRVISDLASCRGRFYYFHSASEYGVIDFPPRRPPAFSTVPMRKVPLKYPAGQFMAMASMHAVDIGGELYTASVVHRGDDAGSVDCVSVYRMDFGRGKPVRVRSIGDRAILAGPGGGCFGAWCPAAEFGLRPNTVYWVSPEDKRLHVCDIATGTDQVLEPCKGVVAQLSPQPFWMVPAVGRSTT